MNVDVYDIETGLEALATAAALHADKVITDDEYQDIRDMIMIRLLNGEPEDTERISS